MIYQTAELEQHKQLIKEGESPEVLYWKYFYKKDIIDITIDNDASGKRLPGGKLEDQGMRLLKYHCANCKLIFGYDRPVQCPGCGSTGENGDAMKPGKPGILVSKLQPMKSISN